MMRREICQDGAPEQREFDPLGLEFCKPTRLVFEEPIEQLVFLLRRPARQKMAHGLRNVKLRNVVGGAFKQCQELRESGGISQTAQHPNLLPSEVGIFGWEFSAESFAERFLQFWIGLRGGVKEARQSQ